MNRYQVQIKSAVSAVEILSPTMYSWFGTSSPPLSAKLRQTLSPDTLRKYLIGSLQFQLYKDFYCKEVAQPAVDSPKDRPTIITPFVEELIKNNNGHGQSSPEWYVCSISNDGRLVVKKKGLSLCVQSRDCDSDQAIAAGTTLRLQFPKDLTGISPGFYLALGGQNYSWNYDNLIRWYWNLNPDGALRFLNKATTTFTKKKIAYRIKVINAPSRFTRNDAVVVYHQKNDWDGVADCLARLYPDLSTYLKWGVPAFTKPLAQGVGLAEDPGSGESFGLQRCRILAELLVEAYEKGGYSSEAVYQWVVSGFSEKGIEIEKPYLNTGSTDTYKFPIKHPHKKERKTSDELKTNSVPDFDAYLQTACDIGITLEQDASWHGKFCNWLCFNPDPRHASEGFSSMVYKSLGPDLYAGASGIALFLAELYRITGDDRFRRTALGAMRLALDNLDDISISMRFGLYSGWAGIALAAARTGELLSSEELSAATKWIFKNLAAQKDNHAEPDLLAGIAGSIVALTALESMLDKHFILSFASRLGDILLERANNKDGTVHWKSELFPQQPGLTGLSHGASGIGIAMLKLFQMTGNQLYRDAAFDAFAYERHWFDKTKGNWPDLRIKPGLRLTRTALLPFGATWCHGAPGIALSRLVALTIDDCQQDIYQKEARIALDTTYRALEATLDSRAGNYSLCHGLSGNAGILLHGVAHTTESSDKHLAIVHYVANTGIKKYAHKNKLWPCGAKGKNPSLMLGLAGIGHFYLRLRDNTIPSVLMPVLA